MAVTFAVAADGTNVTLAARGEVRPGPFNFADAMANMRVAGGRAPCAPPLNANR